MIMTADVSRIEDRDTSRSYFANQHPKGSMVMTCFDA